MRRSAVTPGEKRGLATRKRVEATKLLSQASELDREAELEERELRAAKDNRDS